MERIIVAFTSYPKRIQTVYKVLDSIINQTVIPDKIILYLSSLEFEKFENVPNLNKYEKYGFEIHWCEENLKSHKKWFYAFSEYPDDIIITIDDDVIYKKTAIEVLIKYHKYFPKAVIARRTHLIVCDSDGAIASYEDWYGDCKMYVGVPRMDLLAVGNAGILYPSHIFTQEVFNTNVFMKECQYGDDLWLKVMEVYRDIPVVLAEDSSDDIFLTEYQDSSLYTVHNSNGGNDKQLETLLKRYIYIYNKEKKLIDCIFSQGKTYKSQVKYLEKKQMKSFFDKLNNKIQSNAEIIIYGAGFIGNLIYDLLKKSNNTKIIKAFIVNNIENNPSLIHEIPVKDYREFINTHEIIIVAIYNSIEKEKVQLELMKAGVDSNRIILLSESEIQGLIPIYEKDFNSGEYWEKRYLEGGNSGSGSYNRLADFKAQVLNEFVRKNKINQVVEWGCGDGNQLSLMHYSEYIGYDVSEKAIDICKEMFKNDKTKQFILCAANDFENNIVAELSISLDVIFHLVEDTVYDTYMKRLFNSSRKYVCIYSSNFDKQTARHVRHRKFTDWIETNLKGKWKLEKVEKNPYPYEEENADNTSPSDFYFYRIIEE